MTPPTRIRVGAHIYRVKRFFRVPAESWLYGQTLPRSTEIQITTEQSPGQARDTMLHEVLHACFNHGPHGLEHEDEERVVSLLSPVLLGVLRDNPRLLAFLLGKEV